MKLFKLLIINCFFVLSVFASEKVYFDSKDGTRLGALLFQAENPHSLVLAVHGLQSNSGWLEKTGEYLAANGVTVLAYDRRGSGLSFSARGHADNMQQFIDDIHAAHLRLKKENKFLPVHLHVNCFGARVAIPYLNVIPNHYFQSIVLTSPSTDMRKEASYSSKQKLAMLLLPKNKYVDTPLNDSLFSSKKSVLNWISNDTKSNSLRYVTKSFLLAAKDLTKIMNEQALPNLTHPMWVVLASNDKIVDNQAIRNRFNADYHGELKISEYESDHLIEMGESQDQYRQDLLAWINTH